MSGGRILGGSGAAWLRDAVTAPDARIATSVAEQIERLRGWAEPYAVLVNASMAREMLQKDVNRGTGYTPIHELPVFLTYEIGGAVVVSRYMFDLIREANPKLIFEE